MEESSRNNRSELIVFGYIRLIEPKLSLFNIIPKEINFISAFFYDMYESDKMTIMQVDAVLKVYMYITDYILYLTIKLIQ